MSRRAYIVALLIVGVAPRSDGGPAGEKALAPEGSPAPSLRAAFIAGEPEVAGISPAARDLPPAATGPANVRHVDPRRPPAGRLRTPEAPAGRARPPYDPLATSGYLPGLRTPSLDFAWDGASNPAACGVCTPPDNVGDVGPDHYVQVVNATKVAIFDKTGTPAIPPFDLGSLWGSGTCAANAGHPMAAYDPLADRWVLAQVASPSHLCVAVSQTANPTGAYHTYAFNVGDYPDAFRLGVWPDGYYVSSIEASYATYAFDRARMLAGQAATYQKFTGGANLTMPSDVDGPTAPPAGAPAYFYTFLDGGYHGGSDRIELRAFDVDWAVPANTTYTLVATLPIASFTYTPCGAFNFNCVRQLATTQRFDALGEWPMFRFPYRRFATHETLVGVFNVGGGYGEMGAAPRWFELRKTGAAWTLHQEGTFDPADGRDRTNASIAMDGSGDIAIGFTVSSSTTYPSIRYATRKATDPLGTMGAEVTLQAGGGSQTGSNLWGSVSAMSVDPSSDCRFYFTSQYYGASSATSWATKVGAFTIPECGCAAVPPAPDNPTAAANGANRIDVGWNDSSFPSITRYFVRRATTSGGPYTQIATVADTSPGVGGGPPYLHADTPVSGGTTYYYRVLADDGAGCTSPASAEVSATASGGCLLPPTFAGLQSVVNTQQPVCTLDLSWNAGTSNCAGMLRYDVHRSTISGFTPSPANRIAAAVSGTAYTDSSGLASGTSYHYVVRAVDSISGSDANMVQRTGAPGGPSVGPTTFPSTDTPRSIPDNNPTGTTSTRNVTVSGPAVDVNVVVNITHSWVGDLKLVLRAPDGTTVTLLDRPGVPASTYGCGDNNMAVTFDDASTYVLEGHCAGTNPWYTGAAAPAQPLSALLGRRVNGDWQLTVTDAVGGDTGTLTSWSLVLTYGSACAVGSVTPQEVSPGANMTAAKGSGTSVAMAYTPACGAVQNTVYRGVAAGSMSGVSWTQAFCSVGNSGSASFDPGTPPADGLFYFVIAANDGVLEGSYGRDSAGVERPEASGLACEFTQSLGGSCP